MCGIFCLISDHSPGSDEFKSLMSFKHRGPDYTNIMTMKMGNTELYITLVFHRLSIVDKSVNGIQPFIITTDTNDIYCICNGEIYNHDDIRKKLDDTNEIKYKSTSDCEVLPYLYLHYSDDIKFCNELKDNEFACVIINHNKKLNTFNIFVARDPYGVRPLYRAYSHSCKFICFSSELKGIPNLDEVDYCQQFNPMSYLNLHIDCNDIDNKLTINDIISNNTNEIMYMKPLSKCIIDENIKLYHIRDTLIKSVSDRLMSDRPLGALLSGGLDSSIVCAIASMILKEQGKQLRTFSVGMPGSTDEYYAKKVASFIGSIHTHFTLTKEEFQSVCDETIWKVESYDCTTVRASVCQLLCAKYIYQTTDIKVLLVGDGSDELFGGYVYFKYAPSVNEFNDECIRLVENIHLYDGQRSDRLIASYGMETRSPFQQDTFVRTILSINPKLRIPCDSIHNTNIKNKFIEKCILRTAFIGYLPDDCLWRTKEAFSDGVSSKDDSWYLTSKLKASEMYSDIEFNEKIKYYTHMTPTTKEELYYREIFGKVFSENVANVIHYKWMPKIEWVGDVKDPSARVLDLDI